MNLILLTSALYIATLLGLFLYSFTQVDVSLAVSRLPQIQAIVQSFQHVGYFDRPLSTSLYVGLLVLLHVFYFVFLYFAFKEKISKQLVWKLVIVATVVLSFAYNAFSYDIFNYIFDAKIVTQYQQNPYEHRALDYPNDPMLSFMRWTHREYPYGPVWLCLTVPVSFVGMQLFIPTLLLFKFMMAASFLGCVFFIGKILQKLAPDKEIFGLVFFGLSPLVLIESVVSAHLDIVMMFFSLWAMYFLVHRKYLRAWILLVISIGIKFATVFLVPVFILLMYWQISKKKIHWDLLLALATILMGGAVIAASLRTNFQPWYLLEMLAFAALLSYRYFILLPSIILSLFALCVYVPYVYFGNWDPPIPDYLATMYVVSYIVSIIFVVTVFFAKRNKSIFPKS